MSDLPPRYAPRQPLPPYAFLPGRDPHPTSDPEGHSWQSGHEPPAEHQPLEAWRENEGYLFGVDLYNGGFLWEAHEAWESLWHAAKDDRDQAELLQGLIQCAASALKVSMGQPGGTARLAEAGLARLDRVAASRGPLVMGLDLPDFAARFHAFVASSPTSADERPRIELEDAGGC